MDSFKGRRSTFYKDEEHCAAKLGKVPPPPSQKPSIPVQKGSNICGTPQTNIFEDQSMNYENYWIEKLSCIDQLHSHRNNLNTHDTEKVLRSLATFTQTANLKNCPVDTKRLMDCYIRNKKNISRCHAELQEFSQCIDNMLYEAVRKNINEESISEKKLTYTERFQRGH